MNDTSKTKGYNPLFTGKVFLILAVVFFLGYLSMRLAFEGTPMLVLVGTLAGSIALAYFGAKYLLEARADRKALAEAA